jgi:hypothetical protein
MHDWLSFVKFCVLPFCSFVTVGGVLSPESHDFSHDEGFDSEDDSDHYEDFSSDAGWFIYVHAFTKVYHSHLSHNVFPKWQVTEVDKDKKAFLLKRQRLENSILLLCAWIQV